MEGRADGVATVVVVVPDPTTRGDTAGTVVATAGTVVGGTVAVVVVETDPEAPLDAERWFEGAVVVVVGATVVDVTVGTTGTGVVGPTGVDVVVVVVATGAVVDVVGPIDDRPMVVGGPASAGPVRATTVARPELTGAATPFELAAKPPVAVPSTTRVPTATTAAMRRRPDLATSAWWTREFSSLPIAPHFFRGAGPAIAMPRTAQLIRQPG
jgi:hypothetical protein